LLERLRGLPSQHRSRLLEHVRRFRAPEGDESEDEEA
jgi:hypothetical protein